MKQDQSQSIKSVSGYIEQINTLNFTNRKDKEILWFRGEASNDYKTPLVPGSYRSIVKSCQIEWEEII